MLGTAVSFATEVADGGTCDAVLPSDGEGNLVVVTSEPSGTLPFPLVVWRSHRTDGILLAQATLGPSGSSGLGGPPLASGWFVLDFTGNFQANTIALPYSASLEPQAAHDDPTYFFWFPNLLAAPPGGGMATVAPPSTPVGPPCPGGETQLRLARFDASGSLAASADLGCVPEGSLGALAANASGDVLFLTGNRGWTLHAGGTLTPLLFPFADAQRVFALADGQFAVKDTSNAWVATVSPSGAIAPPPCWLTTRTGVNGIELVQGATAYLLRRDPEASCDTALEYVLSDGTSCGFVPVEGPRTCSGSSVTVGVDGTLATLDPACTVRTWPAAFGP